MFYGFLFLCVYLKLWEIMLDDMNDVTEAKSDDDYET